MNSRRSFFLTSAGTIAGAVAMGSDSGTTADDKPAITPPKVVPKGEGTTVWAMGVQVTVKVRARDTGGAYSAFEDLLPPGAGPVPHTHSKEDETIFVIEGELRAWLGGKPHDLKVGDFVHMPRGVQHYFKNVSAKPTRLLLTYTPGGFEQMFLDFGKPVTGTDGRPPEVKPEEIKRAVAAAEKYGVTFEKK